MTTRTAIAFLCNLMLIILVHAQEEETTKKADTKFDSYAFADAIESYESLLAKGYTSEEVYKRLGNANYLNANYKKASEWYGKLFEQNKSTVEPEYMYRYALTLKSQGKYEESDAWMKKFEASKSQDLRALKYADNTDYLEVIKANSNRYSIRNLDINSAASDFAPSFNGSQLVFATTRDTGIVSKNIHLWNKSPFLNLYSADSTGEGTYAPAKRYDRALNTKTHESSTAFTKDGKTVYFTRNNSKNRNFARDEQGISRLKIYRATLKENTWTNITELPFNGDSYSTAHPALNADGTKLYFASDMPGTAGASDIYVVDINADGTYGTPVNLGKKINTEGRETFPYVTDSNVIYFASDGHPGLGGLDVFATKLGDLENSLLLNLGKPVNSEEDDFSFVLNETTGKGFFASNRSGGKGEDDIYGFVENTPLNLDCSTLIAGKVEESKTGLPVGNAKVTMYNTENVLVAETLSSVDGSFEMDGDCKEGEYRLRVSKADYEEGKQMFTALRAKDTGGIVVLLDKTVQSAPVGTELAKYLNLEPIYFDLDKSAIRPDAKVTLDQVIAYLKEFPNVNVEVQSHTDVRAGNNYNLRLSDRRAKETVAYIVANGISENRIKGKGFGETQLVNECTSGGACSDDKHEKNRRSEFIVISLGTE